MRWFLTNFSSTQKLKLLQKEFNTKRPRFTILYTAMDDKSKAPCKSSTFTSLPLCAVAIKVLIYGTQHRLHTSHKFRSHIPLYMRQTFVFGTFTTCNCPSPATPTWHIYKILYKRRQPGVLFQSLDVAKPTCTSKTIHVGMVTAFTVLLLFLPLAWRLVLTLSWRSIYVHVDITLP